MLYRGTDGSRTLRSANGRFPCVFAPVAGQAAQARLPAKSNPHRCLAAPPFRVVKYSIAARRAAATPRYCPDENALTKM